MEPALTSLTTQVTSHLSPTADRMRRRSMFTCKVWMTANARPETEIKGAAGVTLPATKRHTDGVP